MSASDTDHVARELIASGRNLQVATTGPDGRPHVVTFWYGLLDDDVVCWTARTARTARNLRRDPRVACLLEGGSDAYARLHGVRLAGEVEVVDPAEAPDARDRLVAIGRAILDRNFPADDRPAVEPLVDSGRRVGLVLRPRRVTTWDNRATGRTRPLP